MTEEQFHALERWVNSVGTWARDPSPFHVEWVKKMRDEAKEKLVDEK